MSWCPFDRAALRPAWLGAGLLCATALAGPAARAQTVAAPAAPGPVDVVVTDKGCEPMALSVPAGKSVFRIRNQSRRALEWEILKGVMVVEERENIVPGFVQTLTATLDAGDYQMTCGLLSNPKGKLTVTAAAAPPATTGTQPVAAADGLDLTGPLAEYKLYVLKETENLVAQTRRFTDAIKANKLDEARDLYAPTRQHYERIEPIAELFDDLDKSMDVRPDDFEKKDKDPNFMGFHRLEKAVFADKSAKGMEPVADKLMADVVELQSRITTLAFPPSKVVGGAAALIEEIAKTKISGEEDRYSRTDLWDFQANVDGAAKIFVLVRPLVEKRKPELAAKIDKNLARVDGVLSKYRTPDGKFETYEKLTSKDRNALKGQVTALAEDLSMLRGVLGLD